MGVVDDEFRSQGHPYRRKRYTKKFSNKKRRWVLEYLVSLGLHRWRLSSTFWIRLGNSLKMDASFRKLAQIGMQSCYLSHLARHECYSKELVSHPRSPVWLFSNSWWINFNRRFLYNKKWRGSHLQTYLPLCLPSLPRCCYFICLIDW